MKFILALQLTCLLAVLVNASANDDLSTPEDEKQVIKVSREKAKREGWLPWKEWYDDEEYLNWLKVIRHYYKPLQGGSKFFAEYCPNITLMSNERYQYYIRDPTGYIAEPDVTYVVLMGAIQRNETMWVAWKMQDVWNEHKLNERNATLRFAYVDHRYDEHLTAAYELRYFPSVFVINSDRNGTAYQWDRYEYPDNVTFADWLLNETFRNSSV